MSAQSVRAFLAARAPDIAVIEAHASTATVADAAAVHGVAPGQIAKTLALRIGERVVLLVAAGDARLDNAKARAVWGGKPRMPGPEEVEAVTGHVVGGVCPFGLATPLAVFCDLSLRRHDVVIPAAGSPTTSLRITPERLAALTDGVWVDVCR
ncbi:prolyl-tRNA editing enzyme YbaK/EbsC (Cys-tRNA(Pro) deacylase) [Endobacter medicaginis]|uniref:Prolyl-tRNA editing enzyme YbaK/EbsC (Cys-tRNA(Pro) deacylase) n=3 Tax=Endobacter medicaginis TaxID=1181271 RepID=A0A839V4F0_9PROT|nr:YbaK/EbsC family protein [Endobacter medicaginis]MBB3175324.1 prolyl-tRNA editing enzyme YbaK/EbsC (Cys-tRNA(Pro) deacylase) [Endobacter medicaginis]MCX5476924.1 YbaK/EbsC family protein [Endobacter medicaginis]